MLWVNYLGNVGQKLTASWERCGEKCCADGISLTFSSAKKKKFKSALISLSKDRNLSKTEQKTCNRLQNATSIPLYNLIKVQIEVKRKSHLH